MRYKRGEPATWIAALLCALGWSPAAAQSVAGTVVDEANRPVADALVFLGEGIRADTTGAAGAFLIDGADAGSYRLHVRADGFAPRTFSLEITTDLPRQLGPIVLQPGPPPRATLRGSVTESIGGRPVSGATVEVNGDVVALTDASGSFAVTDAAVVWGPNTIRVRDESFTAVEETGTLWVTSPDEEFDLSVVLRVSAVPLDPVVVGAAAVPIVPPRLEGFTRRMRSVPGRFLTREDIELYTPPNLSRALLRAGLRVVYKDDGSQELHFARLMDMADRCPAPLVFLDGILIGSVQDVYDYDQLISVEAIHGIEAYAGQAWVPPEFSRTGSACGVILIWTRY